MGVLRFPGVASGVTRTLSCRKRSPVVGSTSAYRIAYAICSSKNVDRTAVPHWSATTIPHESRAPASEFKYVGIQLFRAIRSMIVFDEGILIRFPQLDVAQFDRSFRTSGHEPLCDELWPIVCMEAAPS